MFTRGGPVLDYFPDRKACYNFTVENNDFSENDIAFNAYTGDELAAMEFIIATNNYRAFGEKMRL